MRLLWRIIFLLCFVIIYTKCFSEDQKHKCRNETGVTDEEIRKLERRSFDNISQANFSNGIKYYTKCLLQIGGYIDEDGNIHKDKVFNDTSFTNHSYIIKVAISLCLNMMSASSSISFDNAEESFSLYSCFTI